MGKNSAVPDAWDDEWDSVADRQQQQVPASQAPLTKAERLAHHAETNRKIWESAESKQTFHYVEANNTVPLASDFKPQVKVLSRKPVVAKRDPITGMSQLALDDDDDEPKEALPTPEEIRARQKREREEKQRRYEEARAKIFGESAPSSGASSPGAVTPPRSDGRHTPQGRGRGRGGGHRGTDNRQFDTRRQIVQPTSGRELYDPNSAPRPDSSSQRRGGDMEFPARISTPRDEPTVRSPIRAPRGPDGSGRGGFGFARRGDKEA